MEYLLKVSAVIIIFYGIYKLFLQRDTFFESNRWFLLIGLISSCFIPFIVIPIYTEYTPTFYTIGTSEPIPSETIKKTSSLLDYLPFVYGIGVAFLSARFILQLLSLAKIIHNNKRVNKDGFVFIETQDNTSPFSFFKWIVYNPETFTQTELEHIIEHEKTHAKQHHSIDILISQLFCVLFWFNPFMWFYNKDLKQNLEFIADKHTLNQYNCKKSYQYTLLKTSMPSHQMALSNHFYNSLIKKRIIMLHKSKSKKINQLKYALVFPVIALFLMSFNTKEVFINKNTILKENILSISDNELIISGTVANEKGNTIQGATVFNGASGVMTNATGGYSIKANKGDVLIFSFEGMASQSVKVNNETTIDVKLMSNSKNITLKGHPEKGLPPLIIVDGKEVSNDVLNKLDEYDILSINVLKDKKHTSKYGEKGKNGVIEITTKK